MNVRGTEPSIKLKISPSTENSGKMDLDEETPLLIRVAPIADDPGDQVLESRGSLKRKFYGVATAVGSSIAFATYNTYVKRFEQDMVDVLILRSMFEFFVFGGLAIYNGHRFWPDKSECESLFAYKLKCFLLFFQVSNCWIRNKQPSLNSGHFMDV